MFVITASIIADSIGRHNGRISTFVLTYPRFIHSELMTHRSFSRNAASSRAIPITRMIQDVILTPARPVHWGKNQKGMQAFEALDRETALQAIAVWDEAARNAIDSAGKLIKLGVHKQTANRVMEPFVHMRTLVTATDMDNFFSLRADPEAQPEFQVLAFRALGAYLQSTPKILQAGEWHVPFAEKMPAGLTTEEQLKIATARAARVSYLTFDGVIDIEADLRLCAQLRESGHWSPFEHAAQCLDSYERSGNLQGWAQYRKQFSGENRNGVDLRAILDRRRVFEWEDFEKSLAA